MRWRKMLKGRGRSGLAIAFRRGVMQGSRFWTVVFLGRLTARGLSAVARRRPGPVEWSETLRAGQSLTIDTRAAEAQGNKRR